MMIFIYRGFPGNGSLRYVYSEIDIYYSLIDCTPKEPFL